MSENQEKDFKKAQLQSILAVSFYMTVSIGLVFLNRIVLTGSEKSGALFMSWFQFVVAYIIIVIISTFCQKVPLLNLFPPIHYKLDVVIKVLPVSIAYLMMIGLNNKCLENVSVSGYQIVRSLSVFFNIILTFVIFHEKTSLKACLGCAGVVLGFVLGIEGDINLTLKGTLLGVAASFFVAAYAIVVKRVMGLLDNNEYLLIEYNTPIAILILTPIVYFSGEFEVFTNSRSTRFWGVQVLAGVTGFIINIAIFLNIKYTTPLTHNLTGIVKACLQTVLAFLIFKDEVMTPMKFAGTVMTIGFSAYYAYVRKAEMKKKFEENDNDVLITNKDEEEDDDDEENEENKSNNEKIDINVGEEEEEKV
ncbi:GDP-fucose transporter-related protein [Histomonas meleagridis]|uniref:GDP-fucose transporter-related protein n=1 Tax=Histomonas meleagridis TaxID=135588 RepID=UPI0035598C95|nr:GDP-fucose transporter-related protein [Histomonas meleagridis]KAH0807002.1 GDP-fucose transporter-related protein [Histomonas meleagridis]